MSIPAPLTRPHDGESGILPSNYIPLKVLRPTSHPHASQSPLSRWRAKPCNMVRTFYILGALAFVSMFLFFSSMRGHRTSRFPTGRWIPPHFFPKHGPHRRPYPHTREFSNSVIRTPATTRFRDALLPSQKYITAFMDAGWTNDIMAAMTLIHLAQLTRRIPILSPFPPTHVGYDGGFISFGTFFDLEYLSWALNMPIIEWRDIKNFTDPEPQPEFPYEAEYYGGEREYLGCWSVWMTQKPVGLWPREGDVPRAINVDISFTPVPLGHQVEDPHNEQYNLHALAKLAFPIGRKEAIKSANETFLEVVNQNIAELKEEIRPENPPEDIPTPNHAKMQIAPDGHLLCFDYLYFTASFENDEWWRESSPVWNTVGVHLRFSSRIVAIAEDYLVKAFHLPPRSEIPPFIAVHIRRNDFTGWCAEDTTRDECLAPYSAYVKRVAEVQAEMVEKDASLAGRNVRVLVMTDEPRKTLDWMGLPEGESEKWWVNVDAEGWYSVRHDVENTVERYGKWYPSVIDACILSMGSGFVGTDRSTYSLIASRRVHDWANGPVWMVKWGYVGADDH